MQSYVGEVIHGMAGTRLHHCWKNMKQRCYNPNRERYKNYGARGITVCDEWLLFENFKCWAINSGYSDNLTLDRIDPDKNYSPENCRWVSYSENHNLMMDFNKENSRGLFTEESKNKSKVALRNNLGIPVNCIDPCGTIHTFNSRGELVEWMAQQTGRSPQSLKSHINLCLKGKSKSCSGYKIYE